MRKCWFLAVKQELFNTVVAAKAIQKLGLHSLRHRQWFSQSACANADNGFFRRVWTGSLARSRRRHETVTTECVSISSPCAEPMIDVSVEV